MFRSLSASRAALYAPWLVGLLAFAWAWVASGPWLSMGVNWDTASYVALYASGRGSWRDLPWNSHFGIGPVYAMGMTIARWAGGTAIDGVRLVGACAFGLAAVFAAYAGQRLCGFLGCLWALFYVSSWGLTILLLHMEDNVLYLPAATGMLALTLARLEEWRPLDSVVSGVLLAMGILMSVQAGLYLVPSLYVAAFHGGSHRRWFRRLRDIVALLVTAVVSLVVWIAITRFAGAHHDVGTLLRTLVSRPSPSFFPASGSELWYLLSDLRRVFRHVGLGLVGVWGPDASRPGWVQRLLPAVGSISWVLLALATLVATRRAWAVGKWRAQTVLLVALALLSATALYVDLPADKHKRYDFVPLLLTLGAAAATGHALSRRYGKRLELPLGFVLVAIVALQFSFGVTRALRYRSQLPVTEPRGYHGRGDVPWFVYFRRLRQAHPEACLFTFAFDGALAHGRYQNEIPAGLWSELPGHRVVGPVEQLQAWPRAVNAIAPGQLPPPRPCEWRSPGLMDAARPRP